MMRLLLMHFLFLFSLAALGQQAERRELDFVQHLISRNELRESLFLLERIQTTDQGLADSVSYFRGWVLYQQKQLESSASFLQNVSSESPLFRKSRFFAAYNLAHAGDLFKAQQVLEILSFDDDSVFEALLELQLGGIALLQRDFEGFTGHAQNFSGQYNAFAMQEKSLEGHAMRISSEPLRSTFVAGLLSAAVPGLGKVYAGKTAEGIVGFLYVGAMGLTTYDFYRRLGPQHVLFILSSAVTGIFYAGNIWGSAIAVKRKQNEFNHEMDQRILFDMHIPLRNIFQ